MKEIEAVRKALELDVSDDLKICVIREIVRKRRVKSATSQRPERNLHSSQRMRMLKVHRLKEKYIRKGMTYTKALQKACKETHK